jgi:hypothetical protein
VKGSQQFGRRRGDDRAALEGLALAELFDGNRRRRPGLLALAEAERFLANAVASFPRREEPHQGRHLEPGNRLEPRTRA